MAKCASYFNMQSILRKNWGELLTPAENERIFSRRLSGARNARRFSEWVSSGRKEEGEDKRSQQVGTEMMYLKLYLPVLPSLIRGRLLWRLDF